MIALTIADDIDVKDLDLLLDIMDQPTISPLYKEDREGSFKLTFTE